MEFRAIIRANSIEEARRILDVAGVVAHVIEAGGAGYYQAVTHDLCGLRDWYMREGDLMWYGPIEPRGMD